MKCPICGNDLIDYFNSKNFLILRCNLCGLGVTENASLQKSSYHRDETYIEEEELFKNIFSKRVNKILKFKESGEVLEIGCSTGIMLSLLQKKGWHVQGVELSKKAAAVARQKEIDVKVGDFNKLKISQKYDLVILNHTLEHLQNPIKVVEKIKNILKKDGLLYIDLPNFSSITAKLQGSSWPLLLPDEHLWHFTLKSLAILLKKNGFKVIFVERASGIWDYNNPFWGVVLSLITAKKRFFREFLTAIPSWIVSKFGIGSDLMVIAQKI